MISLYKMIKGIEHSKGRITFFIRPVYISNMRNAISEAIRER